MNENELKQAHTIINDIWKYLKEYGSRYEDKDGYWDALIAAGYDLEKAHDHHPLAVGMIGAVWKFLERRAHD